MAKQQDSGTEIIENPDVLLEKIAASEDFVKKNKNILTGVLVVIALAVAGSVFYIKNKEEKEAQAQKEIFRAQYFFSLDSLNLAMKGDGNQVVGFEDIIEDYSGTKAANLSYYYAGVIYLKQGDFNKAIEYLDNFSSSDLLVQARAYSLIGDANMELNAYDKAVKYYTKAAEYNENDQYTPRYLIKLGLAHELNNAYDKAAQAYEKVVTKYAQSSEAFEAKKYLAKTKAIAKKD